MTTPRECGGCSKPRSLPQSGWFGRILEGYEHVLRVALHRPLIVGAGCVLLVAASYGCYRTLGSDLLPAFDEGGFVVDYVMPPGSSLDETSRCFATVEAILRTRQRSRARPVALDWNWDWPR